MDDHNLRRETALSPAWRVPVGAAARAFQGEVHLFNFRAGADGPGVQASASVHPIGVPETVNSSLPGYGVLLSAVTSNLRRNKQQI